MNTPERLSPWYVLLLAGLLAVSSGCIKIDATLAVGKDGSGTLRTIYGMPTFLIKQMELTRQWTRSLDVAGGAPTNAPVSALDIPMVFDEAVLKRRFEAMAADGVKLESLRTREQGGWRYVDFNLVFPRLEDLVKQSFFKECGVTVTKLADNTCKLVVSLPEVGTGEGFSSMSSPDSSAKLTPFVNGLRVIVRIDLPGEIRNSTSMMSDSRRATWEWDFDKDATAIDRLARDRIIVVFDGKQARLREFEKPAGDTVVRAR